MNTRLRFTIVLVVLVIVSGIAARRSNENRKALTFSETLSETIVMVEDKELTLFDLAVYVAYQETEVQKDALIYDNERPVRYWNLHTNGHFIRTLAKEAIVDMAVHDALFYEKALEEGLQLNEEEEAYLANEVGDFCMDLTEEQFNRLGICEEDVEVALEKIALANKCQSYLAQMEGVEYAEYDYTGEAYQALIADYEIVVNDVVWDRIKVGNVTVNYE